eukprot:TRINITY_DN41435_c0_g1_i1.p1 TRINITY_DN41435_c0_g1~~TRINITY_DN41435_c0_g1_i1.p1  ORF type:complete len:320 (-),score=62.86 TRINITY_DN41435_c0_g1_i1:117-1076(-)
MSNSLGVDEGTPGHTVDCKALELDLQSRFLQLELDPAAQDRPTEKRFCTRAEAALNLVHSLALSQVGQAALQAACAEPRFTCGVCGHNTRLYCLRCLWTPLPLPRLDFDLHVLVLRHEKESAAKSSSAPLPMLAPKAVQVVEWQGTTTAEATVKPGAWLVFPRRDATDAAQVDWTKVSQLVLIDSRWKHAKAMAADPRLAELPAMRVEGCPKSCFWRSITEKLESEEGLVSTVECIRHALELRREALGQQGADFGNAAVDREEELHLDDLLLLFALRLRLIVGDYIAEGKCCPWCTETERRRLVHEGNARKDAERQRKK